jgi:hypothetical protein
MFDKITKRFSKKNATTASTVYDNSVVLEALCAQRDKLVMSDHVDNPLVQRKLLTLHEEIQSVLSRNF